MTFAELAGSDYFTKGLDYSDEDVVAVFEHLDVLGEGTVSLERFLEFTFDAFDNDIQVTEHFAVVVVIVVAGSR
jgi:hypothetical protein